MQAKGHFNGHRGSVSVIVFQGESGLMISGATDNSIIVWDIIGETSLYKLVGHHNAITSLAFAPSYYLGEEASPNQYLLSTSKDGLFKMWDLNIQSCVATYASTSNEIWDMIVDGENNFVVLGTNTEDCNVLRLEYTINEKKDKTYYRFLGTFKRNSSHRVVHSSLDTKQGLLFIASAFPSRTSLNSLRC